MPEGAPSDLRVVELAEMVAGLFCTNDGLIPAAGNPGLYSTVAKEDMQ